MAWDSSRPVPWRRLLREWLIYVGVMAVVFIVFFRDESLAGIFAGLLVSGPLYLLIGYVLAKFGYRRRSMREARAGIDAERAARSGPSQAPARPRPAPTRRTGGGGSRPGGARPRR
jgi:hypothetical protein